VVLACKVSVAIPPPAALHVADVSTPISEESYMPPLWIPWHNDENPDACPTFVNPNG
jgi:hypothetical protein